MSVASLLSASMELADSPDDTWIGIVVIACIGLVICAVAIGVVVRVERSEGLEDDLDRD